VTAILLEGGRLCQQIDNKSNGNVTTQQKQADRTSTSSRAEDRCVDSSDGNTDRQWHQNNVMIKWKRTDTEQIDDSKAYKV
jgi:hypothetical protein